MREGARGDRMTTGWNRRLWGVIHTSPVSAPILIGATWDGKRRTRAYEFSDEPSRALLFSTRKQALTWCKAQNKTWRAYPKGDTANKWRVRPVRVRETVQIDDARTPAGQRVRGVIG